MDVTTYEVRGRVKGDAISAAALADFDLAPGEAGDSDLLISNLAISPYCIDPARGEIVLVEAPADLDLATAPFVYDAQYRHATRVHTIGIDRFMALAADLPSSARAMFLHSTGRCGSTLLARAMGGAAGVTMISEPDVFSQLAMAGRFEDPSVREQFARLHASCLKFFMRGRTDLVLFKFRAIVCEHADYLAQSLPGSRSVFLYRDAIEVARSYARLTNRPLADWRLSDGQIQAWSRFAPIITRLGFPVDGYDLMAALWAGPILRYLETWPQGVWHGALNYADLLDRSEAIGRALLGAGRQDAGSAGFSVEAFATHSQADSHLAPDRLAPNAVLDAELASPEFARRIAESLGKIDPRLSSDMILPGSL
jgi:hypothetical protein